MSDIPENQKDINTEAESGEDFSTVFSDPAEHRKIAADVSKKRNWPKVVAGALAAVLLITGTVLVIKLIPEKEDESTASEGLQSITVLDLDSDDFKTVTVTNEKGTFKFYSEIVKEETTSSSSSSSSSATETVEWYLDGYDKELISTTKANNAPDAVASIDASRKITEKTAAECGLESPAIKVDVVTNDEGEFSVLLGGESPDKSGYYLKLSSSEDIYLVESTLVEDLTFDAEFFASDDAIPGIAATDKLADYGTDGVLSTFDSLILIGKDYEETVVIQPNTDELTSQFYAYKVISPTKCLANNVDELFTIFSSGLATEGAYSYELNEESLTKFGLLDPDFSATILLGEYTVTYLFALQEDGYYAVACDLSPLIKKVSADSVPFASRKETDFYHSWVAFNALKDLKKLTIKTPEKEYAFDIEAKTDENDSTTFTIGYNGETMETQPFQDFYQELISLTCSDFTVEANDSEPVYTLVFDYNDEIGGSNVIEFRKASETKYQYRTDGVDMGKVTSASLKKIIRSLESLVG